MRAAIWIFLLAVVPCCMTGCGEQQSRDEFVELQAARDLLAVNKALVLRTHDEVWSGGNLDVIDELYSVDYISHWADGEDSDREGLKKMVNEARSAFPDLKEQVVHVVAEGDLVVSHFISSGTITGESNGGDASDRKISRPEIAIHRIADGKIVEQWTVADQLTLMKQLGLM